jgi:hypothetical protein
MLLYLKFIYNPIPKFICGPYMLHIWDIYGQCEENIWAGYTEYMWTYIILISSIYTENIRKMRAVYGPYMGICGKNAVLVAFHVFSAYIFVWWEICGHIYIYGKWTGISYMDNMWALSQIFMRNIYGKVWVI